MLFIHNTFTMWNRNCSSAVLWILTRIFVEEWPSPFPLGEGRGEAFISSACRSMASSRSISSFVFMFRLFLVDKKIPTRAKRESEHKGTKKRQPGNRIAFDNRCYSKTTLYYCLINFDCRIFPPAVCAWTTYTPADRADTSISVVMHCNTICPLRL